MNIERIQSLLEVLTEGMNNLEKRRYLKDLGFSSWKDVTELDNKRAIEFMYELESKIILRSEDDNYIIKRPERVRSVKDIVFKVKG